MKAFSYTKTSFLLSEIEKIEQLRIRLHMTPLSLQDKAFFRWNALLDKIHYSFDLMGKTVERKLIAEYLALTQESRFTPLQTEVVRFKKAHDFILQNWLASNKVVTSNTLKTIYEITAGRKIDLGNDETDLQNNLRYIQTNPDNPLIQAGLACTLIFSASYWHGTQQMQYHTFDLFLFKYGYDFRRFIVLEEYFVKHKDRYHNLIMQSMRENNATSWLEFVVEAASFQLTKLLKHISSKEYEVPADNTIVELNDRQKTILVSLAEPGSKVSNREIQKHFRVSPITAARDLAKLTQYGFVVPLGKGRSTYYTKI